MGKRKFSLAERYAVWKTLGPHCRWCKEPVEYSECHIDHIVPEFLLQDEILLKATLEKYDLPNDFEVNSFYNWIPVHASCNLSKQDKIIEGAPVFLDLFAEVKANYAQTFKIYTKWSTPNKTAKLIALIERDAENGFIDKYTISKIFAGIDDSIEPVMGLTGSTINNKIFYVPSKETWEVIGTEKDHYILTKDGMTGIAPMAMLPDPDWLCIHCKHYGPWDGNKCLICGQYSFE